MLEFSPNALTTSCPTVQTCAPESANPFSLIDVDLPNCCHNLVSFLRNCFWISQPHLYQWWFLW